MRHRRDWPVALLASGLRGLFQNDVGTGRFDGFVGSKSHFVAWHDGGHGSAFDKDKLPHLASYAVDGTLKQPPPCVAVPCLLSEPGRMRTWSRLMPWITAVAVGAGWGIKRAIISDGHLRKKGVFYVAGSLTLISALLDSF